MAPLGRYVLIATVVSTAIPYRSEVPLSLMGLGYLVWLACLVLSALQRSPVGGWDGLRGNRVMWHLLLLYSGTVLMGTVVWQILCTESNEFLGLFRAERYMYTVTVGHVSVCVLTSLHICFLESSASLSVPPPRILEDCGSLFLTGLMLWTLTKPGASLHCLVFLMLLIAILTVEHYNRMNSSRRRLLRLTVLVSAAVLLGRFILHLPFIASWLPVKPGGTWGYVWSSLDVVPHLSDRLKLYNYAGILITSATLWNLSRMTEEAKRPSKDTVEGLSSYPGVNTVLLETARWSKCILLFVAYFLTCRQNNIAGVLVTGALLFLLGLSHHWYLAATLISGCSMIMLNLQYICRFDVLNLPPEHLVFLGLDWNLEFVIYEVALLQLSTLQRTVQRVVNKTSIRQRQRRRTLPKVMSRALQWRPHIGAVCVLFAAACDNTIWAYAFGSLVAGFVVFEDRSKKHLFSRTKLWFCMTVVVLGTNLLYIKIMTIPGLILGPSPETLSKWPVCSMFEHATPIFANGTQCWGNDPFCKTQQQRCGESWHRWLVLEVGADYILTSGRSFVVFFLLCMLKRATSSSAVSNITGIDMSYDFDEDDVDTTDGSVEDFLTPDWSKRKDEGQELVDVSSAARGRWRDVWLTELWHKEFTPARRQQLKHNLPLIGFRVSIFALWVSMVCTFLTPSVTQDTVSVVYMLFFFWHVNTFANTTTPLSSDVSYIETRSQFVKEMKVLRCIRVFNICVIGLAIVYQCPSFPCRVKLLGDGGFSTNFMTPHQCIEIQRSSSEVSKKEILSLILQSLGLLKSFNILGSQGTSIWNVLIFAISLAQQLVCTEWRDELEYKMLMESLRRQQRGEWYMEHLKRWRDLELCRIDTRKQVLNVKLQILTARLKVLREVWANRREPMSHDAHLAAQHEARILDLCLQSGACEPSAECGLQAARDKVSAVVDEFDTAAQLHMLDDSMVNEREQLVKEVDSSILARLKNDERRQLRSITVEEDETRKQALLKRCAEMGNSVAPVDGGRPMLMEKEGDLFVNQVVFTETVSKVMFSGLKSLIDDHLFLESEGEPLHHHRTNKTVLTLILKALWSQTLLILTVGAALQFATYQSISSSVPISCVILSYMAFPHASPTFWKVVQCWVLFVIASKMIFQLPCFCYDGSIRTSCPPLSPEECAKVPWMARFGVRKVDTSTQVHCLVFNNLSEALWADVLVCSLLLLHRHMLCRGGRVGSPIEIRRKLVSQDTVISVSPGIRGRPQYRRQITLSTTFEETESYPILRQSSTKVLQGNHVSTKGFLDARDADHGESGRETAIEDRSALEAFISDHILGSATMRKPAMDLYTCRVVALVGCFLMILVFWHELSGGDGRTFRDALTSNSFSGTQVSVLMLYLLLIIADRALYTWYTQERVFRVGEAEFGPASSFAGRMKVRARHVFSAFQPSDSLPSVHLIATTMQKLLLLIQIAVGHTIFMMSAWSNAALKDAKMCSNFSLLFFYFLFVVYLSLTSLQMKYDVHIIRGGVGFCHNAQPRFLFLFKIYSMIPFMEEFRVLIDWTVTKTSMNFFMWMKLEDAHQNLYRTQMDMKYRQSLAPAASRPKCEKLLQGGLLLCLLFVLIIAPVTYFSTLNIFLSDNPVVSGRLDVTLWVKTHPGASRLVTRLYKSERTTVQNISAAEFHGSRSELAEHVQSSTLQLVTFPAASDNLWMVSSPLRADFMLHLGQQQCDVESGDCPNVGIEMMYSFARSSSPIISKTHSNVVLKLPQVQSIAALFNPTTRDVAINVSLPAAFVPAFHPWVELDSTSDIKLPKGDHAQDEALLSYRPGDLMTGLGFWEVDNKMSPQSGVGFRIASSMVPPVSRSGNSSQSGTVISLYLGVIWTIGKLLRMTFAGISQRMIFQELSDTELLRDLCNGIYIARINGDLVTEYTLYYELVHIYRSPELLFEVSKGKQPFAYLGYWSHRDNTPNLWPGSFAAHGRLCDESLRLRRGSSQ